jgi:hypothetical protein
VRHAPSVRANAWEDVADLSASFGVVLDPWQETVLQAAMGERSDGTWAARQVAVSTPRQNGKSQLIVARALAGVLLFNEQTIIVSAHQQDTAREVFGRILDLIEVSPALSVRVGDVMRAINRESITFTSGQQIRFKARSKGGGRGFSCDCLLLDEAQILGAAAWSAILPTMSARPNPQAWLVGTPPTELDDGEVFERLRQLGISGSESRLAYLEWSADRDDDPADPGVWAKANPSFGSRISHEAVASEFASMSRERFAEERLGVWRSDGQRAVFTVDEWDGLAAAGPVAGVAPVALAVDMSHSRQVSIAACWHAEGDGLFVEEVWAGPDSAAAVSWLSARAGFRIPVLVDSMSPASSLIPGLKVLRARVVATSAGDMAKACGLVYDMAKAGLLRHGGQVALDAAVAGAKKRPIRDAGGWGWDRRDESVNIAPLVAASLAVLGASTVRRKSGVQRRRVVVTA